MPALSPSPKPKAPLPALIILEPEASLEDDDVEEKVSEEDTIDIEGDYANHDDEANDADEEHPVGGQPEDEPSVGEHLTENLREDANDDNKPPPDDIDTEMKVDDDELTLEDLEKDFVENVKEKEIQHDELLL